MPNETEPIDATLVTQSLQKVAKGAGIVFIGSVISMVIAFIARILIARYYSPSEYGIFSLGYTILFIFATIGTLGLQDGVARQIAYYGGKNNKKIINSIIFCSILFSLSSGIILSVLLVSFSNVISTKLFHWQSPSFLQIFSIAIPFFILILILASIFRGFGSVKEKVFFSDIMRNSLFLILLFFIVQTKSSFIWVIISYLFSVIVTAILFLIYFLSKFKKQFNFLFKKTNRAFSFLVGKKMLIFSLPLLLVTILNQIMSWTDTLMLGYFKTANEVGIYNAALPLGQFISIALGSILFLYIPIASELYAQKNLQGIKRSYIVLTKWLSAATLPLTLVFIFFPKTTLSFLYGTKYISAANVLQILSLGFFINNVMGPNGATLIAMGKTKFLMYVTVIAAIVNVALNIILIPIWGMKGAAVATVTAIILINAIRSIKLYSLSKIHSLEKNIIKPVISSIILVSIIYFIAKNFLIVTFWLLPILFIIFLILYGLSLLITKSFDREDLEILLLIEKKIGINLSLMKKIVNKFE